jgi:hypothetical protein
VPNPDQSKSPVRQEGFSETSQNTYFERILSAARQRRQQTLGADLVLAEE